MSGDAALPTPYEVLKFNKNVETATAFRHTTRMSSPVWAARDERDQQLIAWHKRGLTHKQISEHTGATLANLGRWFAELRQAGLI